MKIFFDTSTLFNRFIDHEHSALIDQLFIEASEVVVSPVTHVEMLVIGRRYCLEKKWSKKDYALFSSAVNEEFKDYTQVLFNEALSKLLSEMIEKFSLKTLDIIQLSSGKLSKSKLFVTSDKQLYQNAKKIMPAQLIL